MDKNSRGREPLPPRAAAVPLLPGDQVPRDEADYKINAPFTICCPRSPGRAKDRLQRGDAAISRHPAPLRRRHSPRAFASRRKLRARGTSVSALKRYRGVAGARSAGASAVHRRMGDGGDRAYYPAIDCDDRYVKWEHGRADACPMISSPPAACRQGRHWSAAPDLLTDRPRRRQRQEAGRSTGAVCSIISPCIGLAQSSRRRSRRSVLKGRSFSPAACENRGSTLGDSATMELDGPGTVAVKLHNSS